MSFSGAEVTEKGLARGWDPNTQDQDAQRIFRNTQVHEATIFRPWAWRPHGGDLTTLRYFYHGGWIDAGAWTLVPDGSVVLTGDPVLTVTNYIERSDAGVVQANTSGFTYPGFIPMAIIDTKGGAILPRTYVDSRPEIGGAPAGAGGVVNFNQIVGFLLPSQIQPSTCYLNAGAVSAGEFGVFGCAGDYTFPSRLGVGGAPILTTAPLQVYGDIDLQGAIRLLNVGNAAENVIFAAGTTDEFARITNFISDSTLWGVRSRTGLVNTDDREATLGLVRTDNAGNEEIADYYNNGFFSSPDHIAVAMGMRLIRTGLDSDPLRGHWRPYHMDWYHGDTQTRVPGYTIWSPEDPGGPCFQFFIPVKLPFSNQMATDLFTETELGKFVLSRATSKKPWTPHDRCASNVGFS